MEGAREYDTVALDGDGFCPSFDVEDEGADAFFARYGFVVFGEVLEAGQVEATLEVLEGRGLERTCPDSSCVTFTDTDLGL